MNPQRLTSSKKVFTKITYGYFTCHFALDRRERAPCSGRGGAPQMHTRWLAGRTFTAVAALLVMAGVFAGTGPAAASAAGCQAWTGAQPPSPGTMDNTLNSVTVLSPCDAWAAGFDLSAGAFQTLIEHWNGSSWAPVDSPDPGSGNNFLNSVRAASPASVWAVGSFSDGTSSKTLILHWN